MKCQFCNCPDSRVVDSRPTEEGASIRRRRECANCGRRFTTYEKVEMPQLLVIKKDNTRELFDAQKIRNGIIQACHKRPVTAADIERIVGAVEQMAFNSLQEEGTTLDAYLAEQDVSVEQFEKDIHQQAEDVAKHELALDAIVRDQGIECSKEDVLNELKAAGYDDA